MGILNGDIVGRFPMGILKGILIRNFK